MRVRLVSSASIVTALLVSASAALLVACGDDTIEAPAAAGPDASIGPDGGGFENAALDGDTSADSTLDGGDGARPPPARLLLTASTPGQGELAVFGLGSRSVEGRLDFSGVGTTTITGSSPWLLEPSSDRVARLDPLQPWLARSTWNVALGDAPDGGDAGFASPSSDPVAIVVGAGTNAYVLRYGRNLVAVIDTSQDVDAGPPSTSIDLSSQVQAGGDGFVEMTAGYFDPQSGRLYVLLGNVDREGAASAGGARPCTPTHPAVIAIDTATDTVVSPGGDGGGAPVGYALSGYDPPVGPSPMVYDPANNRLLVIERGCTLPADGGAGVITRRGVEAVSLADGTVTLLLDLSSEAEPHALFYLDPHHVVLQLGAATLWDPSSTALGPAIAGAPSAFDIDGQGDLVGVRPELALDGGVAGWSVVSVSVGDGGATVLGQSPFSLAGGVPAVTGARLWPPP